MASREAPPIDLRFGAELEIMTKTKAGIRHAEWRSVGSEVSRDLQVSGIKNHVNIDHDEEMEEYSEWSIIQECTMANQGEDNIWPVELVSPIKKFREEANWHQEMIAVWQVLDVKYQTWSTPECGTHVHISPCDEPWTLAQLKVVAKSVFYFETCIDTILPKARRQNKWATSNRYNVLAWRSSLAACFTKIDSTREIEDLVKYVCAFSQHTEQGRYMGKTGPFSFRFFRWNFTPLLDGHMGSIEFRQPPGSSNAADMILWINFAVSFVEGAIMYGDTLVADEPPTLEHLKSVVLNGAARSGGVTDLSSLKKLFKRKTLIRDESYKKRNADEDNDIILEKQAGKKSGSFKSCFCFG